jgi:hypothetical protein
VNTFVGVVLLLAASAVSASPTIISDSPARVISSSADSATGVVVCNPGYSELCDRMSEFAKAFLQPPSPDGRTTSASGDTRCLPALPPAIGMVLTGFLCISLIRDRRAWMTVLAGLLWVGQTGIWSLPELTSRLSRKVHNSRLIEPTLLAAYPLVGDYYPESYNEQTRYTGLLHHLEGIPRQTSALKNKIKIDLRFSPRSQRWNCASQHAIVQALSSLSTAYNCLVRPTRQFICFSPAFIFSNLSRGPPIPDQIVTFLCVRADSARRALGMKSQWNF